MLDLDAYLDRIGYAGPRTPTLATLGAIHERHACTIPFENIDVLLARPIRLDVASLEQKLIHQKRGGYCFEHNTLLLAALRALGYETTPHLARVRWKVPSGVATPQTHMILQVRIEGRAWLADAGFGGVGLTAPLALDTFEEQTCGAEPRRFVGNGRHLLQQVKLGGNWTDVYVFNLDEAHAIDFEVGNWFTSTHPDSRFRRNLMVARSAVGRRVALSNREFTSRPVGGPAERYTLNSPDELLEILATHFDLRFPADTRFPCAGLDWPS